MSEPGPVIDAGAMTQEVRFAVVLTGGASLAIWMGGVAREINLLTAPPDAGGTPSPVRDLYRRLTRLLHLEVGVDVLSGTSAGAINAAALGYANARGGDLAPLRSLWLREGAIHDLLRDPGDPAFPSLLRGDSRLLTGIQAALRAAAASAPVPPPAGPPPTSVFITTTFLRPEIDTFTDDVGTAVRDADHHGLFSFGGPDLVADGAVERLALAARSSASFPGAFEPSFVPVREQPDADHPDMAGYLNAARSHFVADGGLLDNRPVGPALEAIFDRRADRQVRRVLAYVVPTIELPHAERTLATDRWAAPPSLPRALFADLQAALTQSVAAELRRLDGHNDTARAQRDTRRRLAGLRLAAGARLVDDDAFAAYRNRQAVELATPIVQAMMRLVADRSPASLPRGAKQAAGVDPAVGDGTAGVTTGDGRTEAKVAGRDEMFAAAAGRAGSFLPDGLPAPGDLDAVRRLGRPALAAAVATLLVLIREGHVLATDAAARSRLGAAASRLHDALPRADQPTPRLIWTIVSEVFEGGRNRSMQRIVEEATDRWLRLDTDDADQFAEALEAGWAGVGDVAVELRTLFAGLVTGASAPSVAAADAGPPPPTRATRPAGLSVDERRALAADYLRTFVEFLPPDAAGCVGELADLHVAEVVFGSGGAAEAPVELIQVSADTRTALDPSRDRASQKLTGLQLAHFGAFLKRSWRASDWMWGRLDGAGWFVHILLDPRRLVALRDMAGLDAGPDAPGRRASWLSGLLSGLAGVAGTAPGEAVRAELGFLTDDAATVPRSLPATSIWVAGGIQRVIAAEELPVVAAAAVYDRDHDYGADVADDFLAAFDARATPPVTPGGPATLDPAQAEAVLRACRISAETVASQADSPQVTAVIARAAAVGAAMATTVEDMPRSLRPLLWTVRTVTRLAAVLADRSHGRRSVMAVVAGVLMVAGVALATSTISGVGTVGVLAVLVGFTLLALVVWRKLAQIAGAVASGVVILVACAGLIPALKHRLFPWLRDHAVPYLADHPAAWAAVFLLLLVPPVVTVVDLVGGRLRRRRPSSTAPAPAGGCAQETSTQR